MRKISFIFFLFLTGISYGQFDRGSAILGNGYKNSILLEFENDILTYPTTDRYYTNGIKLGYWTKSSRITPVNRFLLPSHINAEISYSISLVHRIYTAFDAKLPPLLKNDRPYASVLYAEFKKTLYFKSSGFIVEGELDAGLIGPYTGGANIQQSLHKILPDNEIPKGWETQIRTDPVINYRLGLEKLLFGTRSFSVVSENGLRVGTLFNDLSGGLRLEAGNNRRIETSQYKNKLHKFSYFFYSAADANLVLYNALLEGGVFNRSNIYTIPDNQIKRIVYRLEAGISIQFNKVRTEFSQIFMTPEFDSGLNHKWGRMRFIISF